jgi:hypothetical protein
MRVARAIFHGGPLGESRGVNTRIGAVELIPSGLVGAGAPAASGAVHIEEDELVLRRLSTRTALAVERVVITFAEMIVAAARSATTPTHIVTCRLRRLREGIACMFTQPASDLRSGAPFVRLNQPTAAPGPKHRLSASRSPTSDPQPDDPARPAPFRPKAPDDRKLWDTRSGRIRACSTASDQSRRQPSGGVADGAAPRRRSGASARAGHACAICRPFAWRRSDGRVAGARAGRTGWSRSAGARPGMASVVTPGLLRSPNRS